VAAGTATYRWQLGLAALAGIAATAYLVQSRRPEFQKSVESAPTRTAVLAGEPAAARSLPAVPGPQPALAPVAALAAGNTRGPAPAGGDRALTIAIDRFAFAGLPSIDRCLGPARGMRRPQLALVDFRREGDARLVVEVVRLAEPPRRPGGSAGQQAIERCLALLVGRDVRVPIGSGPLPEHLQRVVSIPLPDQTPVEPEKK
jgi:hypothetical protein